MATATTPTPVQTTPTAPTPPASSLSANAEDTTKFDAAYDTNTVINDGGDEEGETGVATAADDTEGAANTGEGVAAATKEDAPASDADPILTALAAEMEVDLANASETDLAMLKKMAGQEWVKQKYGAGDTTTPAADATLTEEEYRKLFGDEEEAAPATTKPAAEEPKPTPTPDGNGYSFKTAKEWLAQVQDASEKNDTDRYIDLQSQFVEVNVRGMQPFFEQLIRDQIEQTIGGALPVIRRTAEADHRASAREHALKVLEANPNFKDVRSLFTPDGGQPITYNGRQVESNPLNHILKANPELLKIAIHGKDGKINHAATQAEILMAVHRKWKSPATKAATQQAMKAGIRIGEKKVAQANGASLPGKGKGAAASSSSGGDTYAGELREIAAATRVNL